VDGQLVYSRDKMEPLILKFKTKLIDAAQSSQCDRRQEAKADLEVVDNRDLADTDLCGNAGIEGIRLPKSPRKLPMPTKGSGMACLRLKVSVAVTGTALSGNNSLGDHVVST